MAVRLGLRLVQKFSAKSVKQLIIAWLPYTHHPIPYTPVVLPGVGAADAVPVMPVNLIGSAAAFTHAVHHLQTIIHTDNHPSSSTTQPVPRMTNNNTSLTKKYKNATITFSLLQKFKLYRYHYTMSALFSDYVM